MEYSTEAADLLVEQIRRERLNEINANPLDRANLEAQYGQVWTATEVAAEFEILGFAAPYAVVKRRADGQKGSLEFQHMPRFYFNYAEDK